ncbi:MAG: hypothetical protein QOG60_563 [Frankiaceae bacterium]|jgi:hypothetical protein|nr:hypothetical protein [Frankiaceae bacterium]MDQ1673215.1 hypothetical protein [Frankiaceae bacterium]
MPLSEHEQRLLEQIERALYADDPKLASTIRSTNPRVYVVRRLWRSFALFLLGLATLVAAVIVTGPGGFVLGLVGFGLMLLAALRLAADLKRLSGRPDVSTRQARTSKSTSRVPFMERMEERWRKRWEDRDGR